MGFSAKILVVGLLILFHGLAMGAVVKGPSKDQFIQVSTHQDEAPLTTVGTISGGFTVTLVSPGHTFTLDTTSPVSTHQIRTTQGVGLINLVPESSIIKPTRTGEDSSRPAGTPQAGENNAPTPRPYAATPLDDDPTFTTVRPDQDFLKTNYDGIQLSPRDDYDGYGYGPATPVSDGGYGTPPAPTNLPPGGYGDPPLPVVEKPSVFTITSPVTVPVSLASNTLSIVYTTPIVTITVTSTPDPQGPMENVTFTESNPASPLQPLITPQMPADDPPATTTGIVYTTVTSTSSGLHTPTLLDPPKPVTDTNAAESAAKLNQRLLFVVVVLAVMSPSMSLASGFALLMSPNNVTKVEKKKAIRGGCCDDSATGHCNDGSGICKCSDGIASMDLEFKVEMEERVV